jgi:hypothetical protein
MTEATYTFIGTLLGISLGAYFEWLYHRQFCNCKHCALWRQRLAEKSVLKRGETPHDAND